MEQLFTDPWLYLTAFGFLASAALLVYLVQQFNAASATDEEVMDGFALADHEGEKSSQSSDIEEDIREAPAAPPQRSAAPAVADALGSAFGGTPAPPPPSPGAWDDTKAQEAIEKALHDVEDEVVKKLPHVGEERRQLTTGEAYLHGLHEDLVHLKEELRADMDVIRGEFQKLEDKVQAVLDRPPKEVHDDLDTVKKELKDVVEEIGKVKNRLPPPAAPPPAEGDLSPFQ